MNFNPLSNRYPSRRSLVYGAKGMVCTSQPLAAQAGLDILKRGGNAVDAAVAAAACLTVVEPTSNGVGGDAFAIVWSKGKLYGLNASGPAPALADPEALRAKGYTKMPRRGWNAVTVPGIPSAWSALAGRFGKLPFEQLFEPAISYAEEGYPVSPVVSLLWERGARLFSSAQVAGELTPEEQRAWFAMFAPDGRAPKAGELWKAPDLAQTLRLLAQSRCSEFYHGTLAERIDAFSKQHSGALRAADLGAFSPEWVEPLSVHYRGYDVWELPPNGHGLVVLMTLNLLKQFEFGEKEEIQTIHRQLEAMKIAYADGQRYIAEPSAMQVTAEQLLSEEYARRRAALIGETALEPFPGDPNCGGTVYLCTADAEGNMVSYIQSNYNGFGSGLVVPGTGISLHNRGYNFSLDPNSDNCLAPGKRPYHTIIPGFLTQNGKAVGPFGVMGAFMQPQGHVQVIANLIDFGLNPQEALDAPRWQWTGGKAIELEPGFPSSVLQELERKGHSVSIAEESIRFGRGQMIFRNEDAYVGASEPRADGLVAAW